MADDIQARTPRPVVGSLAATGNLVHALGSPAEQRSIRRNLGTHEMLHDAVSA